MEIVQIKKAQKVGNSFRVIVPKILLDTWKTDNLKLEFDGEKLVITPYYESEKEVI